MKHNILIHSIAALLVALPFTHAEDQNSEEKKEAHNSERKNSSSSVVTSADGTATITIDINGKKETRTFKLGDGNNTFTFGKEGDGAKAGGTLGLGGKGFAKPEHGNREKGPWIGIAMEPVQEVVRAQLSLAPGEGVVISHVAPESPAEKVGIQTNDILLRFEDQIIVEPSQLKKLIAMKKPGESVKLTYLRKGERKDATVTFAEHEIEPDHGNPIQLFQNGPGGFNIPGGGMNMRLEQLQDQLRQMKDKHPGVIVDKRAWISGASGDEIKGQLEKLQKELEKMGLNANEVMEQTKRALEEAMKAQEESREPHKSEKGKQLKKPGESL